MSIDITSFLTEILKIESITGNEKTLCNFIEESIKLDLQDLVEIKRVQDSLVVFGPHNPELKTVIMAGHLDTVPGSAFGDNVCVKEDRIIGLGASDMKSGVAVMRAILDKEILQNSRFNIIQVYYHSEEHLYETNGIHVVFEHVPEIKQADFCFLLEPTNGEIQLGCMGLINMEILFRGKRAHSARPWEGDNAIYKALEFIRLIKESSYKKVTVAGLEFIAVKNVTLVSSGIAHNVIPDECCLTVNVRIPPGDTIESASKEIHDLVKDSVADIQSVETKVIDSAPACPVPENNQILEEFKTKFKLSVSAKQAYNDVAVFSMHGIPAISFGPGLTAQAHQAGEYVLIKDLLNCFQVYQAFL